MNYELYHHGILGMKWGVRRFQNKDGTLTAAGKKRYENESNNSSDRLKSKQRVKFITSDGKGVKKRGDGLEYSSYSSNAASSYFNRETITYFQGQDGVNGMQYMSPEMREYWDNFEEIEGTEEFKKLIEAWNDQMPVSWSEFRNAALILDMFDNYMKIQYNTDSSDPNYLKKVNDDLNLNTSPFHMVQHMVDHAFGVQRQLLDYLSDPDFFGSDKMIPNIKHGDNMTKDELSHHGILGMKWGVRRFQNADGSLTAAGRRRYGKALKTIKELDNDEYNVTVTRNTSDHKPKNVREKVEQMSDDELKKALERVQNEQKYIEAYQKVHPPKNHPFKDSFEKAITGFIANQLPTLTVDAFKKIKANEEAEKRKEFMDSIKDLPLEELIARTDRIDRNNNLYNVVKGQNSRYIVKRDAYGRVDEEKKKDGNG